MKSPEDFFQPVSALIDNELSESRSAEIRRRVLRRTDWRREYEELTALSEILSSWDRRDTERVKASPGFQRKLRDKLKSANIASSLASSLHSLANLLLPTI